MTTLKATLDLLRALKGASGMKVNRSFEGFFADRIVQSATQPDLTAFAEHLARSVDAAIEYVGGKRAAAFMAAATAPDARAVLAWIRRHPRVAAMVCMLRDEADYAAALESIRLPDLSAADGHAPLAGEYAVPITAICTAPLAHGSDQKSGNATLFRRGQVLSTTGAVLELPYYAGNALRGQLRDLLADHLLASLGLTPSRARPPVPLWFFHVLYAGGVLEESGEAGKAVKQMLGDHGAVKIDGIAELREMLPALSLLGTALGNRIIAGRLIAGDLRPRCREWGTGDIPAAELMTWEYLTRREDHEGRSDEDGHHGMIATTECLRAGTVLDGGCDLHDHISDLEASALGLGLTLLANRRRLGAENRRGLGQVRMEVGSQPDPTLYETFLADRREAILDYLTRLGALTDARDHAAEPTPTT